jgi:hypothetical protein
MLSGQSWKTTILTTSVVVLLFFAALLGRGWIHESDASSRLILEVINRHFTVGRKIPSVYLRVYSDGLVECHTVKYWHEVDSVKKATLSSQESQDLKAELQNPELSQIKKTYGLIYPVVDSWMEWEIKIPHGWHEDKITVLNFSPVGARKKNQPYPDALVTLGCTIWKVRKEVYGDESYYGNDECRGILGIH